MTPTETETLSPKQASFLADLLDKRTGYTPEFEARVRHAIAGTLPMSRKQASTTIDWLLAKPKVAKAATAGEAKAPLPEVGLYRYDEGAVYRVYLTQTKRIAARILVITETTDGWAGRFEFERGAQYRLAKALAAGTAHAMTEAEATEFGKTYAFCCNCAADLSEDRSLAAGFGKTCASHRGWHYPTKAEAAEILGRPVL